MPHRQKAELVTAIVLVGIAATGTFWLIPAFTVDVRGAHDISPMLVPRLSLGLCLLLGIVLTARAWRAGPAPAAAASNSLASDISASLEPEGDADLGMLFDLAVWMAASAVVVALFGRLGFIVTGGLLLAFWLIFAGVRRPLVIAAVSLITPVVLERLCWYALRVDLP